MHDDLTIQLFLFTCAVPVGVEAMKASGWRLYVFCTLTILFVLAGVGWPSLKGASPSLSGWLGEIAASPQSWFFLVALALVAVAATGRKVRTALPPAEIAGSSNPAVQTVDLPDWLPSVPRRLDNLSQDIDKLARLMGSGDDRLNESFGEMRQKVDDLASRFDKVNRALRACLRRASSLTAIAG